MRAPRATGSDSPARDSTCRGGSVRVQSAVQLVALALVWCLAFGADVARAEPLVLLLGAYGEPHDSELASRIRGQTQDLPLTLEVASAPSPVTVEMAGERARGHGAQIVVWGEITGPAGLTMRVLDIDSGELRTRSLSTSQRETLASSTTAEMAALVVRSELSALLADRAARDAAPAPEPPPPILPPSPAEPPVTVAPRPPDRSWWLGLGYRPSLPIRDQLAHGLLLEGRRELGKLALGVAGHLALPITLSDPDARIRLLRGGIRFDALRTLELTRSVRLFLGGALGVSLTGRSTRSTQQPLERERNAITAGATVGLVTELHWQWSAHTGLGLGAGLDGVLWRTKFAYELPQGRRPLAGLARLEPWLILSFFTRFAGFERGR